MPVHSSSWFPTEKSNKIQTAVQTCVYLPTATMPFEDLDKFCGSEFWVSSPAYELKLQLLLLFVKYSPF